MILMYVYVPYAKHFRVKIVWPSKVEWHLEMNAWRDQWQPELISECGQAQIAYMCKCYAKYIIANFNYFQTYTFTDFVFYKIN